MVTQEEANSNDKMQKTFVLISAVIPGILFLVAYYLIKHFFGDVLVFSLIRSKHILAPLIAGYAFTSLGFLLVLISIAFNLPLSYKVKKYKARSTFNNYILAIKLGILMLCVTFLLAILLLSNTPYSRVILNLMMITTINSIVIITYTSIIILNLSKK